MPHSLPGIAGKDEFLAVLAHELRNPLSAIENALRVMEIADLNADEKQEIISLIRRQSRTINRLIDDLTDVSRINKGKLTLSEESLPVKSVMQQAIESVSPSIECGGHELIVEEPEDDGLHVLGDRVRLQQVFSNLLTNACKYTKPGGRIVFSCRSEEEGRISFRVSDNGIGIRPDTLPHIFEMFHQENRSKNASGLGIGLSLVKQLVGLHNGTVEAHSEGEGLGSSFLVTFPVFQMTPLPRPLPCERGDKLKIIVMDDTPDAAGPLAMIMGHLGYEARPVLDGVEGIELSNSFPPDVALIDIQMPNMGGVEVAQRLAKSHPSCLLIAMTGYSDVDYLGYFHHQMSKPVDLRALNGHIALLNS
jgi:CheY-like chemotaxis protein/two-component sensor histidine kinase